MNQDLPTMQNMNYAYSNMNLGLGNAGDYLGAVSSSSDDFGKLMAKARALRPEETTTEVTPMAQITRRIVQVFIADPNENVPLTDSLLYKGEQKLTDATDQELFYEVPIIDILKAHNEKRVKMIDKEVSKKAGKDIFLEPAKIRDLKMIITNIAQF
jgi:hypothetical protein